MSHEPGRERHMVYTCEYCHRAIPLMYNRTTDTYICEDCYNRKEEANENENPPRAVD